MLLPGNNNTTHACSLTKLYCWLIHYTGNAEMLILKSFNPYPANTESD